MGMYNAIDIEVFGLKCDNCEDYYDRSVMYKDYKKSIGKPCPKCGASLLTLADYKTTRRIVILSKIINIILFPIMIICVSLGYTTKGTKEIKMNGSGKIKF